MLILFFLHVAQSKFCPIYQCSPFPLDNSTGQCIEKEGFTYNLGTCSEEFYTYCPPNQVDSYCQLPISPSDINVSYPGEQCTYDRNCLDSLCLNGVCNGFPVGHSCERTSQCAPGNYCNSTNFCQGQKNVSQACSSDYECFNNLGCYGSVCTPYFTISAGSSLKTCVNGINYLCQTGACGSVNNSWVCLSNLTSNGGYPKLCGNDGDCVVISDKMFPTYSTNCQCGFNPIGGSFCNLAPGDKPFQTYINYMITWFKKSSLKCHTLVRDSLKCIQQNTNLNNYAFIQYYRYQVLMYPYVQMNDDCIKEIFTRNYWDAYTLTKNLPSHDDDDDSFSTFFILSLGLVVIF